MSFEISYEEIGLHFNDYANDDNYITCRTKDEMCKSLDFAKLDVNVFSDFFKKIKTRFNITDIFEIMTHCHINLTDIDSFLRLDLFNDMVNIISTSITRQTENMNIQTILNRINALENTITSIPILSESIEAKKRQIFEENQKQLEILAVSPNRTPELLYSILNKAYKDEDNNTLQTAVNNGCVKSIIDRPGNNVLLYAASLGYLSLVSKLIELGADFGARNNMRSCILHKFAVSDSVEGVKFALKYFSANECDGYGRNALHYAAMWNRTTICEYLCNSTQIDVNKQNNDGNTPLQVALECGNEDAANIIRKYVSKQ